ncbi:hypothetical protein EXN66_Car021067 [Channa argus]|uniref:Uncharacterized protein n=1 Tax=Channa argus TaxID=215402 RepID=A0A6G1QTH1_CHAAH|nr:hypothetical protein EXN66_Car021067 [Channa argus]
MLQKQHMHSKSPAASLQNNVPENSVTQSINTKNKIKKAAGLNSTTVTCTNNCSFYAAHFGLCSVIKIHLKVFFISVMRVHREQETGVCPFYHHEIIAEGEMKI